MYGTAHLRSRRIILRSYYIRKRETEPPSQEPRGRAPPSVRRDSTPEHSDQHLSGAIVASPAPATARRRATVPNDERRPRVPTDLQVRQQPATPSLYTAHRLATLYGSAHVRIRQALNRARGRADHLNPPVLHHHLSVHYKVLLANWQVVRVVPRARCRHSDRPGDVDNAADDETDRLERK